MLAVHVRYDGRLRGIDDRLGVSQHIDDLLSGGVGFILDRWRTDSDQVAVAEWSACEERVWPASSRFSSRALSEVSYVVSVVPGLSVSSCVTAHRAPSLV